MLYMRYGYIYDSTAINILSTKKKKKEKKENVKCIFWTLKAFAMVMYIFVNQLKTG